MRSGEGTSPHFWAGLISRHLARPSNSPLASRFLPLRSLTRFSPLDSPPRLSTHLSPLSVARLRDGRYLSVVRRVNSQSQSRRQSRRQSRAARIASERASQSINALAFLQVRLVLPSQRHRR